MDLSAGTGTASTASGGVSTPSGRTASHNSPFLEGDDFLLVALDDFQGPLDLLLHLIKQQDIDVFDIPIARITEQFLKAVAHIRASDLDNAGEFLEMASSLIRIKAQMLLPRREEEEDADPRAELVRRLLEYEQIREISQRLASSEADRARRFPKGWVEPRPRPEPSDTPLETTWEEVLAAALEVEMPVEHDRRHLVTTRPVAMEDKIELILEILRGETGVRFSRLLWNVEELQARMHGVMTLLASLELTRRRDLVLRQASPFADLWLYRRDPDAEGEDAGIEDKEIEETDPLEPDPAVGADATEEEIETGATSAPSVGTSEGEQP